MATIDQKNQFIALTATGMDPTIFEKDPFQVFLKDPEKWTRLAEFIAVYKRRTYPSILTVHLPEPKFPDWSKGRILKGDIRQPVVIDFAAIMASPWFHPCQLSVNTRPSGHEVLAALVASYKVGEDKAGQRYVVAPGDAIQGHFGLKELQCILDNWATLPPAFKAWAKGKLLYGYRDILRGGNGCLHAPCLYCGVGEPYVRWCGLGGDWGGNEPGLWEQVDS